MRECWIEHDRCAINCPCNAECPDGCPEPCEDHPCDTWFCKGYIMGCAATDEWNREKCEQYNPNDCENAGCCWVPFEGDNHGTDVPYCHYPIKVPINQWKGDIETYLIICNTVQLNLSILNFTWYPINKLPSKGLICYGYKVNWWVVLKNIENVSSRTLSKCYSCANSIVE